MRPGGEDQPDAGRSCWASGAGGAAGENGAVELHLGMAQLHAKALGAAVDAVIDHAPHTHAVLDGDDREIGQRPPCAEPQLGQRHQIGVVVHMDGQAEVRGRRLCQGHTAFQQNR